MLTGGNYRVSYCRDYRGSFLLLTSKTQRISINLWAVGSFSGLSKIVLQKGSSTRYSAAFFFNQALLGLLDSSSVRGIKGGKIKEILPFFEIVEGKDIVRLIVLSGERFETLSFETVQYLFGRKSGGGYIQIEEFDCMNRAFWNDRQSEPWKEIQARCIKEAKQTFRQLALILREYGV
ncbi:MAG: hypothetical protein WCO09_03150 [bacterium]